MAPAALKGQVPGGVPPSPHTPHPSGDQTLVLPGARVLLLQQHAEEKAPPEAGLKVKESSRGDRQPHSPKFPKEEWQN
jgi:hypothetical protein